MPPDLRLNIPHLANAHASAIEPTAVTSQEIIEIVPTSASLVGSMMIPDPIHHGEDSELYHAHLVGLTHNFSPFSRDG